MISLTVDITGDADDALRALFDALNGQTASALNEVAGRAAVLYGAEYHRAFNTAGGWNSPGGRTWGPGRESTGFGATVAESWYFDGADNFGATIANAAPHLAHKVKGGTIRPKRAKNLTLPMVPEAHGRRVADYEIRFAKKLFAIKGKHALFESLGDGTIRPVYALADSVTHKPWPGALPPDDEIAAAFLTAWRNGLADLLEAS